MKTTYTIKAGDLHPDLVITLEDHEGNPLDLTPFDSVSLRIAVCAGGRILVSQGTMQKLTPLTEGKVSYAWQPGDTDKPGDYLLEVTLVTSGKKLTVPNVGYGKLTILPRL